MEKSFKFKVNGIQIEVESEKLTVLDILELAKEKGAIPGDPKDYFLQGDKGKYEDQNALIDLNEDNQFITIPNRPTQVA